MTSPTGRRPRGLLFYGAVLNFVGLIVFLFQGNVFLAIVSGLIAVACVFSGARPRGGV